MSNRVEIEIEYNSSQLIDALSEENQVFYRKHTELVNKLRSQIPPDLLADLLEVEELFNERIVEGVELYKRGFIDGIQYK
ncbi:hypothetical protein ACFSVM_25710, partial [Paenibacillus shunpengii]